MPSPQQREARRQQQLANRAAASRRYRSRQVKTANGKAWDENERMPWDPSYFSVGEIHSGSSLSDPETPFRLVRHSFGGAE